MMQISASPWRVLDTEHQKAFSAAVALRQKFVPRFVELAKKAAKSGEPIMRPLEYGFPDRGYADIHDEFMMGDDLLVAPVATKGTTKRTVVIPPGEWRGADGCHVTGPCVVEVLAPLEALPYFTKCN